MLTSLSSTTVALMPLRQYGGTSRRVCWDGTLVLPLTAPFLSEIAQLRDIAKAWPTAKHRLGCHGFPLALIIEAVDTEAMQAVDLTSLPLLPALRQSAVVVDAQLQAAGFCLTCPGPATTIFASLDPQPINPQEVWILECAAHGVRFRRDCSVTRPWPWNALLEPTLMNAVAGTPLPADHQRPPRS